MEDNGWAPFVKLQSSLTVQSKSVRLTNNNPHQNLPEGNVLQNWNLVTRLNSQNLDQGKWHGWSATIPRMVTDHSKGGHKPSKMYHKEMYYILWIRHIDLTYKIKIRWSVMDGQPPSPRWSPTIQRMVTHHPKSTRGKCTTDVEFGT